VRSLALRMVMPHRDAGEHSISAVPADVDNVQLRYSGGPVAGRISAGIGYEHPAPGADSPSRVNGFINWQQGF
jgi:hypothetical protein